MSFELTLSMLPGWAPISTSVSYEQLLDQLGQNFAQGLDGKLSSMKVLKEPLGEIDRALRSVEHRLALATFLVSETDQALPVVVTFQPFDIDSNVDEVKAAWSQAGEVVDLDDDQVQGFVRSSTVEKTHSAMFGVIHEIVVHSPARVVATCFAPDAEVVGHEYVVPLLRGLRLTESSAS